MTERISFTRFLFDEELTKFPTKVIEYFRSLKLLDLSEACDIDMIPRGLKGVDIIQIKHEDENDFPRFIAPDFMGKIGYRTPDEKWHSMPKDLILKAKQNYIKYRKLVEASRHPENGLYPVCVLPTNMSFVERGKNVYLDLSRTKIAEKPFIFGVTDVIMPSRKESARNVQTICQKSKVYE